jgi:hypothetical protein
VSKYIRITICILTITLHVSWNQRCVNEAFEKCRLKRSKNLSKQNVGQIVMLHTEFGLNSFVMYCPSLYHPISHAKCQKPYLLNTLVVWEQIIYLSRTALSFHQKNNYSHIYWMLTLKIIEQSCCETLKTKSGLFRWPSNCSLVPRPLSTQITRVCTLMRWRASICNVTENKGVQGGIGTSAIQLGKQKALGTKLSMSDRTWLLSVGSENMITKANSLGKHLIKIRNE